MNKHIFFIILALFIITPLAAQEERLTPDSRIAAMTQDDDLDADTFIRTSFIASGASDEEIPALMEKMTDVYDLLSERLAQLKKAKADSASQSTAQDSSASLTDDFVIETSLKFLYEARLTMYSENQTRTDIALTRGSYNCVSSAVLFMYLMKKQHIPVIAVETPLHAFCTVLADNRQVDVETTNPWGFDPGKQKDVSTAERKKFVTVPAKKYADRRNVPDRRILALIYNNRISQLQAQGRDDETVGLALDAMILQKGADQKEYAPYVTFTQCVYNAAANEINNDNEEQGLALTAQAAELYGDTPLYHQFAASAVGTLINKKTNVSDYTGANEILRLYQNRLDKKDYDEMYESTLYNSLVDSADSKPFDDALAGIKAQKSVLTRQHYVQLVSYVYSGEADRLAKDDKWLEAAALCTNGLEEIPGTSSLTQQKQVYENNYAVSIHNKAAMMFNNGDKDGARAAISEGLSHLPNSTLLMNDSKRLGK